MPAPIKPYTLIVNKPIGSTPVYRAHMMHVNTADIKQYVKDNNLDVACVFAGHLYNAWPEIQEQRKTITVSVRRNAA